MTRITGSTGTPQAEKAQQARGTYNAIVENIRADRALSQEGKDEQVAQAYQRFSSDLQALEADEKAAEAREMDSLKMSLFGLYGEPDTNTLISYRDAEDRVANISSEDQALERLERAHLSKDKILTQAIVSRATSAGWHQVLNAWAEQNPSKNKDLQRLYDIQSKKDDLASIMGHAMTYSTTEPPEVSRARMRYGSRL